MAQYLVPTSDFGSQGAVFINQDALKINLYQSIDEAPAVNTSDWVGTESGDSPGTKIFTLSSGVDPEVSTGHILRVRGYYSLQESGGPAIVSLRLQDYISLDISSGVFELTDTDAEYTYTLSGVEADAITDYSALKLRVDLSPGPKESMAIMHVTQAHLQLPDAPVAAAVPSNLLLIGVG